MSGSEVHEHIVAWHVLETGGPYGLVHASVSPKFRLTVLIDAMSEPVSEHIFVPGDM